MKIQIITKSQRTAVTSWLIGVLTTFSPWIIANLPDAAAKIQASAFVRHHSYLIPLITLAVLTVLPFCRSLAKEKSGIVQDGKNMPVPVTEVIPSQSVDTITVGDSPDIAAAGRTDTKGIE